MKQPVIEEIAIEPVEGEAEDEHFDVLEIIREVDVEAKPPIAKKAVPKTKKKTNANSSQINDRYKKI